MTATTPTAVNTDAYFFEKDKSDSVLILGLGNYLMGDEGLGVHLIEKMSASPMPDKIDLLDGGTGGFLLLDCIASYGHVVLVDATMDGQPPGTISLIKPRFASDFPSALSVHDVGLKDMVEALYLMGKVPEMHLFTVSISKIDPMSVALSPEVANALEPLKEKITNLVRSWPN